VERKRLISDEDELDITKRVVGETKLGKGFKIGQYTTGMFFVHFADGGQVPAALGGRYLRYEDAERAIKGYIAKVHTPKKKERVKRDG
jgi:hypothetical protein